MTDFPRRTFLAGVPTALAVTPAFAAAKQVEPATVHAGFPAQDPTLVQDVVRFAHFDLDAVRDLVTARPAIARASWDWGFGDWESALGAASHMGNRAMIDLLMSFGARPTHFTFAALDHVDALRAIVEANDGIQRILGPHGITLLGHARNGKARRVIDYLEELGGADDGQKSKPLTDDQKNAYLGTYAFGDRDDEQLTIVTMRDGSPGIRRGDRVARHLFHLGEHTFHPTGAPEVRVRFRMGANGRATAMFVHDADLVVEARRVG